MLDPPPLPPPNTHALTGRLEGSLVDLPISLSPWPQRSGGRLVEQSRRRVPGASFQWATAKDGSESDGGGWGAGGE